jgi:chromosome segregation ATPase
LIKNKYFFFYDWNFREKSQLHRLIDKLTVELQEVKDKCDELREARQEAARELLSLQDQHQEEIRLIRADLQDEANSREGMDKRLNDLRAEVILRNVFSNIYECNFSWRDCKQRMQQSGERESVWKLKSWHWKEIIRN